MGACEPSGSLGGSSASPPIRGLGAPERDESARLRRENNQLWLDRGSVKSRGLVCTGDRGGAVGFFRFMSANQACSPVATMARVLGVSKAGYSAWVHPPPSAHATADEVLLKRVRTVHASQVSVPAGPIALDRVAPGIRNSLLDSTTREAC